MVADPRLVPKSSSLPSFSPESARGPDALPKDLKDTARQSQAPAPQDIIAVSTDLSALKPQDIIAILKSAAEESQFWKDFKSWYDLTQKPPSSAQTLDEFQRFLTKSSSSTIVKLLETYSKTSSGRSTAETLRNIQSTLSSPEFQKTFRDLQKNLGILNTSTPYAEVFSICSLEDQTKKFLLRIIPSKEFREFQGFLRQAYGIDPNKDLPIVAMIAMDPDGVKQLKSSCYQEAFKILKRELPGVIQADMQSLSILDSLLPKNKIGETNLRAFSTRAFEQNVKRVAATVKLLDERYKLSVSSASDLELITHLSEKDLALLRQDSTLASWEYIKTKHPVITLKHSSIPKFLGEGGFLAEYISPIHDSGNNLATIDSFLKQHSGSDLSHINFGELQCFTAMTQPKNIFARLCTDSRFKDFLSKCRSKHPSLAKDNSVQTLAALAHAYLNQGAFNRFNDYIATVAETRRPELNLKNWELKIKLLEESKTQKMTALKLGKAFSEASGPPFDFYADDKTHLDAALQALRSPVARRLYECLLKDWGYKTINFGSFLQVLASKEDLTFFLDTRNSQKSSELCKEYKFELAPRNFDDIKRAIGYYETLHGNREKLAEYLPYLAKNPDWSLNTLKFSLLEHDAFKSPLFFQAADIVRKRLNLTPDQTLAFLDTQTINQRLLSVLNSDTIQTRIKWCSDRFQQQKADPKVQDDPEDKRTIDIISRAAVVRNLSDTQRAMEQLDSLRIELPDLKSFSALQESILKHTAQRENFLRPEFLTFSKHLDSVFYDGKSDFDRLENYLELYEQCSKDPNLSAILNSDRPHEVLEYARKRFRITYFHSSMLPALLQIASDFNSARMEAISGKLSQHEGNLTANDLVLLSEIVRHPEIEALVADRKQLIASLRPILNGPHAMRPHIDQVEYLLQGAENLKSEGKMAEAQRKEAEARIIKRHYSETPLLESMPSVQLLRASLMCEALKRPEILSAIGENISVDIADKNTEYGGRVLLEDGRITFRLDRSISNDDGSYGANRDDLFISGIGTFHQHALETDNSPYSGPSGWIGAEGDINVAYRGRLTDYVITTMGHTKRPNGSIDETKLTINVDMYYVDKRDPNNPKPVIFDLGIYTVPYTK